jgi:hypothetical protein
MPKFGLPEEAAFRKRCVVPNQLQISVILNAKDTVKKPSYFDDEGICSRLAT